VADAEDRPAGVAEDVDVVGLEPDHGAVDPRERAAARSGEDDLLAVEGERDGGCGGHRGIGEDDAPDHDLGQQVQARVRVQVDRPLGAVRHVPLLGS
jgi:hypothetical protein